MRDQTKPLSFDLASIPWEPRAADGTRSATLVGERKPGVQFTYAFEIPPNFFDSPHSHPADAHLLVARGELLLGYGATFDSGALHHYPVGSFLWVPAGVPHFDGAAKETVLIGTATGHWGTEYLA